MKRKLNKKGKIAIATLILLIIVALIIFVYKYNMGPVTKKSNQKEFIVEVGENYYTISKKLKEQKLIRSELFYKLYLKTHKPTELKEGIYILDTNMGIKKIVSSLGGDKQNSTALKITFQEGLNMRQIAEIIVKNTNNKEEDVYNLLKNKEYIKELINNYWFLTNDITDKNIYYPLEGYLFPDTYEFINKDVTVKEIFEVMLKETDNKLSPYKDKINSGKYDIHEIITLASIVELEAKHAEDRPKVAKVLYNRINKDIELGSDVTTYYGLKLALHERDLTKEEIATYNSYNTRSEKMKGKLPIGPVSNPSLTSIEAVLNPDNNNYYYFVADKNGKTYFNETLKEHENKIQELKDNDLWYTY